MNSASCARPGCADKPAAWLAYDYEARCAWLDDQPDDASGKVGRWPLCERHADNLKVPRGWFCVDRRASHFGAGSTERASSEGHGRETDIAAAERPARRRPNSGSRLTAIL